MAIQELLVGISVVNMAKDLVIPYYELKTKSRMSKQWLITLWSNLLNK